MGCFLLPTAHAAHQLGESPTRIEWIDQAPLSNQLIRFHPVQARENSLVAMESTLAEKVCMMIMVVLGRILIIVQIMSV
jgi:hypothetical protein